MYTKFIQILCVGVLVTAQELSQNYCSVVDIESAKTECINAYADGNIKNLQIICPNVECFLQCLHDAIGECSNQTLLFREDFEVYKAMYRAKCVDYKVAKMADVACQVDTPCVDQQFHDEQVARMNTFSSASHAEEVKQLDCRFSSESKTCITVSTNNNCTPELADFKQSIETVQHSLAMCGIAQEHPLFRKYGGELQCTSPKIKSDCFTSSVMSRISKCPPVTLTSFISQDRSLVDKICDSVECTSQCYKDAVGDCYSKDQHVMLDPVMFKVSARAACDNIEDIASTIQNCLMVDPSCLHALGKALTSAHMLIQAQEYKKYKDLVCSATEKFRSCIVFEVSTNCSESMATLAKNLYEVWHTYSGCGEPTNALFQKYSAESSCEASEKTSQSSSSSYLCQAVFTISLLFLLSFLIKYVI